MTQDEKIVHYEDMLGITEDNDRYMRLRETYGMSPGASWLLSRFIAAGHRWLPKGTLIDAIPGVDDAVERDLSAVKVRVHEIRKRLGGAAIQTDNVLGYRLAPGVKP